MTQIICHIFEKPVTLIKSRYVAIGLSIMPRGGKREGAGRKVGSFNAGEGMPTHVIRVSTEVSKELAQAIPELVALINHWEEEAIANPEVRTYDKLRKFIDEVHALGF